MSKGFLKIQLYDGDNALHGARMTVLVQKDGETLQTLETDEYGATGRIELEAPDLTPGKQAVGAELFTAYDIVIPAANGFMEVGVYGVQIFDTVTSVLNIHLEPISEGGPRKKSIYVPRERGGASGNESEYVPTWGEINPAKYSMEATESRHMTKTATTNATPPATQLPRNLDMTALIVGLMLMIAS